LQSDFSLARNKFRYSITGGWLTSLRTAHTARTATVVQQWCNSDNCTTSRQTKRIPLESHSCLIFSFEYNYVAWVRSGCFCETGASTSVACPGRVKGQYRRKRHNEADDNSLLRIYLQNCTNGKLPLVELPEV
jgi:hypothetical protein